MDDEVPFLSRLSSSTLLITMYRMREDQEKKEKKMQYENRKGEEKR